MTALERFVSISFLLIGISSPARAAGPANWFGTCNCNDSLKYVYVSAPIYSDQQTCMTAEEPKCRTHCAAAYSWEGHSRTAEKLREASEAAQRAETMGMGADPIHGSWAAFTREMQQFLWHLGGPGWPKFSLACFPASKLDPKLSPPALFLRLVPDPKWEPIIISQRNRIPVGQFIHMVQKIVHDPRAGLWAQIALYAVIGGFALIKLGELSAGGVTALEPATAALAFALVLCIARQNGIKVDDPSAELKKLTAIELRDVKFGPGQALTGTLVKDGVAVDFSATPDGASAQAIDAGTSCEIGKGEESPVCTGDRS